MDEPTGQEQIQLLTTDEVLNKNFQAVKFREGYDPVEVDNFLDRVVATIYYLNMEKQNLQEKLEAAERRITELQEGSADASGFSTPAETAQPVVEEEPQVAQPEPEPEPEPVQPVQPVQPATPSEPESATSMLALAQRVHDEYVRDGREESERIIAEARTKGDEIVADAESKHETILAQLDQERGLLENKINELRGFETEYRQSIRTHLKKLLTEVNEDSSEN